MAYCGQCGFKNPDGARFCGECGADLTLQEVGNVENIVNESGEAPTMDENAMEYVPLDTPSEVTEPVEVTPASTFEPDVPTPVTAEQQPVQPTPPAPPAPQPEQPATPPPPPVTPPTPAAPAAEPVAEPVAPKPVDPPASASQHEVTQTEDPAQSTSPVPPKKGNGFSKTCLGLGCAGIIIFLLVIGGLCWWGYDYFKKHGEDIEEVVEDLDAELQEEYDEGDEKPDTQTYDGKTLKLLAEEQGFPSVTYSELPKEGPSYFNDEDELAIRFNYMKFTEGDYIGIMTLSDRSSGDVSVFRFSPCGCSIYHLNYPADPSVDGYIFVYKAARRILFSNKEELREFTLPELNDEEDD